MEYSSPGQNVDDVKTPSIPTPTAEAVSTAVDSADFKESSASPIAANRTEEDWSDLVGVQSARELKRKAAEDWREISDSVDRFVGARPKTVALTALGAGVALGFLAGILVQRSRD